VTTYHGAYGETNAAKRLYNGVMARGDVTIANSGYTAELIAGRYGTARGKIEVIHRGIDPARFDPSSVSAERVAVLRQRWGVGDGERVVLHMARLLQLPPVPYLIAVATASNIGSVATITGNPQNMLIGSLSVISYAEFRRR